MDVVAAVGDIEAICRAAGEHGLEVERFEHSVNITSPDSDLRIQLQTDKRYQEFVSAAKEKNVLGYKMQVAQLEDVLEGKVWAYMDKERRKSKRQKDLADIFRIIEKFPQLQESLPQSIREELSK
jgi:ornithine carbamoyltransferase